jgi:hypothetical protein
VTFLNLLLKKPLRATFRLFQIWDPWRQGSMKQGGFPTGAHLHRSKSRTIYFQIAANFECFCRCAHVAAKHGREHGAILQKKVS